MVGMILALAVVDWHAPGGRSPNYAVVPTSNGAIVRRNSLQATYLGRYGDRGFAVGLVSAAPFRGKRIVVESSVAMTVGSGGVDAFANVWGPEGVLTDDDSDTQRRRLGSQASRRFGSPTGRTLVTPISAETRLRVATALRSVAVPFDETGTAALAAVARATEHARIIGLGETAHGSGAEDARAADVFRFLATHDDVRVLAIEGMYGTTRRLDAYVGGAAEDVDERLRETNFYAFQTREFRRLLDWMRAENARRQPARRLHVVGVDMQYVPSQEAFVLARLAAVDPAAAGQAKRRYARIRPNLDVTACLREARAVTQLVRRTFRSRGIDEEHAARTIEQSLESYVGDASARDHAIAENIAWSRAEASPT